jgi:membrane protein
MRKDTWRQGADFVRAVAERFFEDRSSQTAGSLTYTTLLSIVPLLTVALALSTAFPVFDQLVDTLEQYVLENFVPDAEGLDALAEQIQSFTEAAGRLTAIGLAGLALTSVLLMLTIDESLNRIFRVRRRRPMVLRLLTYWAVITLGPVLVGASLSMTSFLLGASFGWLQLGAAAEHLLGVLPFVLTWATLALLYIVVPYRHVGWRDALIGALLAAVMFEMAKRGFAFYITRFPTYTLIYGTFATLLIFLLWLYVSWMVVLIGATVTAMLPAFSSISRELRPLPGRELRDALQVLRALSAAQADGTVLGLLQISRDAGLMPYRAEMILDRCLALGWVAKAEKDGWLLARDAKSIQVGDVYRAFVYDADSVGVSNADMELSLQQFSEEQRKA